MEHSASSCLVAASSTFSPQSFRAQTVSFQLMENATICRLVKRLTALVPVFCPGKGVASVHAIQDATLVCHRGSIIEPVGRQGPPVEVVAVFNKSEIGECMERLVELLTHSNRHKSSCWGRRLESTAPGVSVSLLQTTVESMYEMRFVAWHFSNVGQRDGKREGGPPTLHRNATTTAR